MDKERAKKLIRDTFNYSFDEGKFREFAINLVNDINEQKGFGYLSGNYIRHSFKDHITKYRRLGTYTDPNGEKIDVLVVHLKNEWALERSRTMLRNFTSDYLKERDKKDAALVAYYTTSRDDWRFSYIQMEYKREQTDSGKFKIKTDVTPAKRYSFLVGENEPNHTAQSQLVDILADEKNPTLTELETAFSVEVVTKKFYEDYRAQFEKLQDELNDIVAKDSKIATEFETKTIDTANFAKKLMGQIVFLYFLQKKGWLGVTKDEGGNFKEWGTGPKNFLRQLFNKKFANYSNFFNDVLEPLFYEALATERSNDVFSRFNCKIPFLNGGLFEPINNYNWEETDICIDNDLIKDILTTFDRYNFTVQEDEPLEKEVAVDPEMLGKVFENLLPENLKKGKGAYYTPRTIVHYMCQESLINYIDTECNLAPKEDIETLIREGDIILELETAIVEQDKKYKPVLMDSIKNNALALDNALANIKVCDPAVGSGAFPLGMLTEIIKARKVLKLYLDNKHSIYELKRHCIQNSLYGVDIDSGAIEIAKLRLWLSLVVDEDNYQEIQPLPNLDYKIMQGNSLIEEFHGISLDIKKKPDKQEDIFVDNGNLDVLVKELHQKQNIFFNAEHPKEKQKKREAVENAIYNIFDYELKKKKSISPQKAEIIERDLKEMTHGNRQRKFFPWKLYFADVFREKGGFDMVIANPPYISYYGRNAKQIDKKTLTLFQNNYDFLKNTNKKSINTVMLFLEKAINLLKEGGNFSYIIDIGFLEKVYKEIRVYLSNYDVNEIIVNIAAFENVASGQLVMSVKKKFTEQFKCKIKDDFKLTKFTIDSNKFCTNAMNISLKEEVFPSLNKTISLGEVCQISCGLEYGALRGLFLNEEKLNGKYHKVINGSTNIPEKYSLRWDKNKDEYVLFDKSFEDTLVQKGLNISKSGKRVYFISGKEDKYLKNKIFIRQSALDIIAVYDENHYYALRSIFCVNQSDNNFPLKYILALLNSKFISSYSRIKGIIRYIKGKQPQIRVAGLEKIPIKSITHNERKPFINLVNQILSAKKANPQADTTALEAKIDQLVYKLYSLTDDEIRIIEESAYIN